MLFSPCSRCHPGPWAPCTHCPTPSERPGQLGARSASVSPKVLCFIHPIPSPLISLSPEASCSASPGSWPLPSVSAPTLRCPLLGEAIAVPCHREEMEQAEGTHHPSRHHTSNTLEGLLSYLPCAIATACSLSFSGPPEPKNPFPPPPHVWSLELLAGDIAKKGLP